MSTDGRIYAIGDVHGQLDLLHDAHARIAEDRKRTGDWSAPVIHLGDLVDRGPNSAGVIDYLIAGPAKGGPWLTIKGNHDHMFALFMADPTDRDKTLRQGLNWLHPRLGGNTTLASYGLGDTDSRSATDLHPDAVRCVPAEHIAFINALPFSHQQAGALFVHAGIRPNVPIDAQIPSDMMWIRNEFHIYKASHGPLIVHGHTPIEEATHYGNRLNLDTGAAYGGPLSVAVMEDASVSLLTTIGRKALTPQSA